MGWWNTMKDFLKGAGNSIVGALTGGLVAGSVVLASTAVVAGLVFVIVILIVIALVDYYLEGYGEDSEVPEDFSSLTDAGEFTYHASIHLNNTHFCSGAFIGTHFILTVGQCVYTFVGNQIEKSKLKVYVGIREVPSYSGFGYAVDKIIIHPKFDAHRLAYNLAVLKLTEKVTKPNFVTPITLPSPRMNMEKTKVLVSGFRNMDAPSVQAAMKKSEMIIIKHSICSNQFSTIANLLKFCAIPAYRWKPCQTSRGGPAANKDMILMGLFIMENPLGCAKNLSEIFLDVSKFLDFIEDATK